MYTLMLASGFDPISLSTPSLRAYREIRGSRIDADHLVLVNKQMRMSLWTRAISVKEPEDAAAAATIGFRDSRAAGPRWYRKQERDRSRGIPAKFTARRCLGCFLCPSCASSLKIMGIHAQLKSFRQSGESGKSGESGQSHGLKDGLPECAGGRGGRLSTAAPSPPSPPRTASSGTSIGPTSGIAARRQPASCGTCAARTARYGCNHKSSST